MDDGRPPLTHTKYQVTTKSSEGEAGPTPTSAEPRRWCRLETTPPGPSPALTSHAAFHLDEPSVDLKRCVRGPEAPDVELERVVVRSIVRWLRGVNLSGEGYTLLMTTREVRRFSWHSSNLRLSTTIGTLLQRHPLIILRGCLWRLYYGARARASGTCLVAVLHAASVIRCWVCATGAASQHPMTLAICNTATRHVPPALALAP